MIRYYGVRRIGTGESGFAWTVRDSIRILVLIIGLQYGPDVSISDLRYTITTAIDFAMYVVSHMYVVDLIDLKWGLAMLMGAAPPRSPGLPRPAGRRAPETYCTPQTWRILPTLAKNRYRLQLSAAP